MSAPRAGSAAASARSPAATGGTAPTRCFHCGAPNPARTRWTRTSPARRAQFCCAGCLGVARRSTPPGSTRFYDRRTRGRGRRAAADGRDDEWSHWDDAAAAQAGLVRDAADGRREASLLLEGIHCGACVWLIESWLARQPGVVAGAASTSRRGAPASSGDPAQARLSDVLRAIAAIGYRAYPYDPGAARGAGAARVARAAAAHWPSRCSR